MSEWSRPTRLRKATRSISGLGTDRFRVAAACGRSITARSAGSFVEIGPIRCQLPARVSYHPLPFPLASADLQSWRRHSRPVARLGSSQTAWTSPNRTLNRHRRGVSVHRSPEPAQCCQGPACCPGPASSGPVSRDCFVPAACGHWTRQSAPLHRLQPQSLRPLCISCGQTKRVRSGNQQTTACSWDTGGELLCLLTFSVISSNPCSDCKSAVKASDWCSVPYCVSLKFDRARRAASPPARQCASVRQ